VSTDRLLENLHGAKVDFVIIGGVAAVLHGSTLLTRDLDICVPVGSESLLRLQAALQGLNPRIRAGSDFIPLELGESKAAAVKNPHITTDEGRLDCIGFVDGVGDYSDVLQQSMELDLGRFSCRVLGLDALIRAKESAGRPHDLQTIVQLRALQERDR
jgi:hypothetical protein